MRKITCIDLVKRLSQETTCHAMPDVILSATYTAFPGIPRESSRVCSEIDEAPLFKGVLSGAL